MNTPSNTIKREPLPQASPSSIQPEHNHAHNRRAAAAATAGTVVEWFDFAVYGFMATTLAAVFFPNSSGITGLLETFAVFAVAFLFRPLGGAFFGALADKIGRRKVLTITVFIMTGATGVIGLVPDAATIGILAPILLTLARCAQGFTAGGEYSGAATYMLESVSPHQRAQHGSKLSSATFASFAAAAALVWVLETLLSDAQMLEWGWRIPFLIAIPLGLIAWWIRLDSEETKDFKANQSNGQTGVNPSLLAPIATAIRTEWPTMLKVGGFISCTGLSFYIFTTYMTTFLRTTVGLSGDTVLFSNLIALTLAAIAAPIAGRIIDRFPRKKITAFATLSTAALAIPAYLIAGTGSLPASLTAQILLGIGAVTANCITSVIMTEGFRSATRASSAGLTYNITYAVFGGTAPFISTALVSWTGSAIAPAAYMLGIAIFAYACSRLMKETSPVFIR